ncbi:oxidoreductase [Porifericola rhodea]|uniref:oxidoreductase n=1 Tax=Porifericola rhodea TaxID=930972 RepID=UPI0026664EC4|nr:oxidoreductase [Porifericola rhodea]WKN29973.1 oxidoreductase [Porifericola rhodea]
MSQPILKVGIVAYGHIAKKYHAPLLQALPGFEIVKVYERHHKNAEADYPGVKSVASLDALLNDDDIGLIVITSPNQYHFAQAKAALEAGKHVVLEKPFTVSTMEAEMLLQVAKTEDKILSVFHNRRWDGDFKTVKKVLNSGMLGELVEFESRFDRFINYQRENYWREQDIPGAGVLYDLGPHLIDQALQLFGKPKQVFADIRKQRKDSLIDDYFDILFYYDSHKVRLKAGNLVKELQPRFILHGTQGSYVKYGLDAQRLTPINAENLSKADWGKEAEENWGTLNTYYQGLHINAKVETLAGSYQSYYQDIYEAITMGHSPQVSAQDALDSIELIELALSSHQKMAVLSL